MTNKTETELLQDAIRASGGTCDDLPDTLPSTLLKKLIETCSSGGGGGGSGGGGSESPLLTVFIYESDGKYTASHTYDEVVQAHGDGKIIRCSYNTDYFQFCKMYYGAMEFLGLTTISGDYGFYRIAIDMDWGVQIYKVTL